MSEIRLLIEKLITAGVAPVEAAEVVTRAAIHGAANAPQQRSAGAIRQERYRRNKASQVTQSDASFSLPLEESSPTPPKTQTPSLFQKDIPPKGGISKKVSPPPETPLLPDSQSVAGNGKPAKADKRGSRIPDGWEFGDAERETAAKLGIGEKQARAEFEHFHDHWHTSAKADAVKKSWPVAWRMWCRNTIKYAAERRNRYPSRPADEPTIGMAAVYQNSLNNLRKMLEEEQNDEYSSEAGTDWQSEPEIIPPDRCETRGFDFGDEDFFDLEARAYGSSNVVNFGKVRAYG